MCIDCYSIAMKIVQQPKGTPLDDKYLAVYELSTEEIVLFGNALKETDVDHDGDDFIHGDRCNCCYLASCKEHILLWVKDRERSKNSKPEDRARMSAPGFISIKTSSTPNAGLGAFAEACIPVGMVSVRTKAYS
uniref:Acyl-CoA N-acyltransferase n=1 Tax=Haemonchus contortus TaxID=6289 RepID=A0A7I4YKS4_HAECO